jgi:alcohol dehydrogenase class IV
MSTYNFRAVSYPWRLHSGDEVIEQHLQTEVERAGAQRAFVICSNSIATRTNLLPRIEEALDKRYAGAFAGIEKDSTYASVVAATEAAREAGADLLVAVGGGSVIVAVRAVDIFLCEEGDPFEIMTQYPKGKPAYSPRLLAPKLPIINIPTTPTGAMNRAGTGLKNPDLDQRMEYFDPKTRPVALLWDSEAALSAPPELLRSTATTTFSGSLSGIADTAANPLVEGDRRQAFRLTHTAYPRIMSEPDDVGLRIDLFTAAFLQNRAQDDGQGGSRHSGGVAAFQGNYAIATAVHIRYPHIGQGEATSVLMATQMRRAPTPPPEAAARVAGAFGLWRDDMSAQDATLAIADALEDLYRSAGMPVLIRELGIPQEDFPAIARETTKNFNFNAGMRSEEEQIQDALDLMEAAW